MRPRFRGLGSAAVLTMTAPLVLGGGSAAATITPAPAPTQSVCSQLRPAVRLGSVEYADRLVRAWGRGDRGATECYATASTARSLFAHATPGGIHWRRISTEGAAGTIYVTYHDDGRGGTVTIGVQNVGLREHDGWHAAYRTSFQ
jgi:hypothetical protein